MTAFLCRGDEDDAVSTDDDTRFVETVATSAEELRRTARAVAVAAADGSPQPRDLAGDAEAGPRILLACRTPFSDAL